MKATPKHPGIDEVFLCDTPGFCDTSGPEVDTVNGIGMVEALRGAASVKIWVVIPLGALESSYKSAWWDGRITS